MDPSSARRPGLGGSGLAGRPAAASGAAGAAPDAAPGGQGAPDGPRGTARDREGPRGPGVRFGVSYRKQSGPKGEHLKELTWFSESFFSIEPTQKLSCFNAGSKTGSVFEGEIQ